MRNDEIREEYEMDPITGLTCREFGHAYPLSPLHVCEMCFGPLEVQYDYASIRQQLSRDIIASRPASLASMPSASF